MPNLPALVEELAHHEQLTDHAAMRRVREAIGEERDPRGPVTFGRDSEEGVVVQLPAGFEPRRDREGRFGQDVPPHEVDDDQEAAQPAVAVMEGVQRLEEVVNDGRPDDRVDVAATPPSHPHEQVAQACLQIRTRRRGNESRRPDRNLVRSCTVAATDNDLDASRRMP